MPCPLARSPVTITLNRSDYRRNRLFGVCYGIGFIILVFVWAGMGFLDAEYCCPPGYVKIDGEGACHLGNKTVDIWFNSPCPMTMLSHIMFMIGAVYMVPAAFDAYDWCAHTRQIRRPPAATSRVDADRSVLEAA